MQYPTRESLFEYRTFKFTANTIDGKILEFPYSFWMRCDLTKPLYQDIVRAYDKNECIVARKVYLVAYGGHLYGTEQFTNMDEFVNYRNTNCRVLVCCTLTWKNCFVTVKGKRVTIKAQFLFV